MLSGVPDFEGHMWLSRNVELQFPHRGYTHAPQRWPARDTDICHHHLFLSPSVGTERLINPEMLPAWQPLCPTSPAFHMADPLQSARSPDNLALHALDEKGRLLFLEEGSGYSARKNSRRSHISEKKCGVEMYANSTT